MRRDRMTIAGLAEVAEGRYNTIKECNGLVDECLVVMIVPQPLHIVLICARETCWSMAVIPNIGAIMSYTVAYVIEEPVIGIGCLEVGSSPVLRKVPYLP